METVFIQLIPILGMLLTFAAAVVIVLVVSRSRTRRLEIQTELQSKLIDRFGSASELVTFLQSKAGQDFVRGVQSAPVKAARDRASFGIRVGIVFTAIAAAFLVLWPITDNEGLAWPGIIFLAIGCAYFASAYTVLRFARSQEDVVQAPTEPPPATVS